MPIIRSVAVLRDSSATAGLVAVAVVAIAEGVAQRLDLPSDSARLLWAAVQRSPEAAWCSSATFAVGDIAKADVVAAVLACVLNPTVGVRVAEAALEVLSGCAAAPQVTDRDLLAIAEIARGRLVHRAANVVRAVCEARRVPHDVIAAIAEGWSRRPDVGARISALGLADVLAPVVAYKLIERALSDEHSGVRATAALRIADVFERAAGLALVERMLAIETHNTVVADLLNAKGELLTRPNP